MPHKEGERKAMMDGHFPGLRLIFVCFKEAFKNNFYDAFAPWE